MSMVMLMVFSSSGSDVCGLLVQLWPILALVFQEAASNGADLVVLPEMWNCPYSNDSFPVYAEDIDGEASESAKALSDAAASSKVVLIGGSIPEKSAGNLYNTCLVYGRDGKLLGRHRKVVPAGSLLSSRLLGLVPNFDTSRTREHRASRGLFLKDLQVLG